MNAIIIYEEFQGRPYGFDAKIFAPRLTKVIPRLQALSFIYGILHGSDATLEELITFI